MSERMCHHLVARDLVIGQATLEAEVKAVVEAERKRIADAKPKPAGMLFTPKQQAERAGVSESQVRSLIASGRLAHVMIGSRVMIPADAFEEFLQTETVKLCREGPRLRWLAKRGCFYITWTERGRSRERSTGTADREHAEASFAEWLNARGRRDGPRDPSEIFVTDVLTDYAQERAEKVAAPVRIGCAIEALTPFWQGRMVADVTPRTCGAYERHRAPCLAGTVRRELGVLRAAINLGHKNGTLTRPVAVELPQRPEPKDRWLTRDEAARLLGAARQSDKARLHLPLFILIGLYTGRCKQAILSLRWCQVDLEAGRIDFEQPGRRTKKRKGLIPIPPRLLPHLIRARRRGSELGYVVHRNGKRIGDIKKGFEAACRREELAGVSAHTLKHTAITWSMQNGTDPWQAAGFFAISVETLLRVYGHHHPDFMREAAENIGRRPQNVRVIGRGF